MSLRASVNPNTVFGLSNPLKGCGMCINFFVRPWVAVIMVRFLFLLGVVSVLWMSEMPCKNVRLPCKFVFFFSVMVVFFFGNTGAIVGF